MIRLCTSTHLTIRNIGGEANKLLHRIVEHSTQKYTLFSDAVMIVTTQDVLYHRAGMRPSPRRDEIEDQIGSVGQLSPYRDDPLQENQITAWHVEHQRGEHVRSSWRNRALCSVQTIAQLSMSAKHDGQRTTSRQKEHEGGRSFAASNPPPRSSLVPHQ